MSPLFNDEVFQRQCKGKRQYRSRKKAKVVAERMSARDGSRMIAYGPCQWCHYFHVGHDRRFPRNDR